MPFWAADIPEELFNEEYNYSDNNEAVNMEFLNSGFQIDTGDDEIETLQDFTFFDWAGGQELTTGDEEVIQEFERVD